MYDCIIYGAGVLHSTVCLRFWERFFPIVYNFGTNVFLGQISYITKALALVLQLGVTMDYSIFLLHRYQEEKKKSSDRDEAMSNAIQATFTSITSSSITTVAGFLALCAMQLTLGRDIGIVMAKGVVFGVLSTIIILPALLMLFDKYIEKWKHPILFKGTEKRLPGFLTRHYKINSGGLCRYLHSDDLCTGTYQCLLRSECDNA